MLIIRRPNMSLRPRISGKWTALTLVACFAVSAVLIPVAAHLPHWIEFELVLLVWWTAWLVVLSWMLLHAHVVELDAEPPHKGLGNLGDGDGCLPSLALDGCIFAGAFEPFGCLALIVVLLVGVYFFVEFLLPGIAFLLYLAIRAMLGRVTDDRRNCEDKPGLAFIWGAIWATAYTAPIALIVWGVHALSRHPLR